MNFRTKVKLPADLFKQYDKVKYIPNHVLMDDLEHPDIEVGFVSSFNELYVFIKLAKTLAKFGWAGTTSQSCCPENLVKVAGQAWPHETF